MSTELIAYVSQYGYLAVFSLVLLYELGVPNPFPQELLLIMSGALAFQGTLNLGIVLLVAVSADVIGTSVLYTLFYFLGHTILEKKPRWLPFNKDQYEKMVAFLAKRGKWGIFLWRLIPYARGYASVGAGLLQVPPRTYFPMVAASALVASGGYVVLGYVFGEQWQKLIDYVGSGQSLLIAIVGIILVVIIVPKIWRALPKARRYLTYLRNHKKTTDENLPSQ